MSVVDIDREEARSARDSGDADFRCEVDAYAPGDGDIPPWMVTAAIEAAPLAPPEVSW